ncbi:MAG: hypothetical protein IKD72_01215 [Clostridia bacterium]|nr:hypothetical protein [Clostridia bacterium]
MYIVARTVHIRHTEVRLRDLPEQFDGTTILYLTDLNLFGTNTPEAALALMERLRGLYPDLILLGGDFASPSPFERLNFTDPDSPRVQTRMIEARTKFLTGLRAFATPLGKFAIAGESDVDPSSLRAAAEAGGVDLLSDDVLLLTKNGARVGLVGLKPNGTELRSLESLSEKVTREDCVIVLAHSPEDYALIQTTEAANGGGWADLVLCGHTRGGQIVIGGHSLLPLNEHEQRYLSGWRRENDAVLLTSAGVGCQWLNFRLGTQAEVHLITLRRGEPEATGEGFVPPNPEVRWDSGE